MMLMSLKINLKKLYRIQYNGITSFKESRKLKVKVRLVVAVTVFKGTELQSIFSLCTNKYS